MGTITVYVRFRGVLLVLPSPSQLGGAAQTTLGNYC